MGVEASAQVEEEALAHPRRQHVVAEADEAAGDGDGDEQAADPDERVDVARDEDLVDEDLEEPDRRGLDGRVERDEEGGEQQPRPVAARIRPEAPHDRAHGHRRRLGDRPGASSLDDEGGPEPLDPRAHAHPGSKRPAPHGGRPAGGDRVVLFRPPARLGRSPLTREQLRRDTAAAGVGAAAAAERP